MKSSWPALFPDAPAKSKAFPVPFRMTRLRAASFAPVRANWRQVSRCGARLKHPPPGCPILVKAARLRNTVGDHVPHSESKVLRLGIEPGDELLHRGSFRDELRADQTDSMNPAQRQRGGYLQHFALFPERRFFRQSYSLGDQSPPPPMSTSLASTWPPNRASRMARNVWLRLWPW